MNDGFTLRAVAAGDAEACARVVCAAFNGIAAAHNFPPDFPAPEMAVGFLRMFVGHPAIYGVVAEAGGRVVGSNFLDERDAIRAVGPIAVDPAFQGRGCGRALMRAVIDRGRGAAGVRLVQDAFNTTSMSLYASLGFEAKEPLALMRGKPTGRAAALDAAEARPLRADDLDACAALCRRVHGFDRTRELRDALTMFSPFGLFRDGRVVAYASAPAFWPLNHGVGETDQDLADVLLAAAAAAGEAPLSLLVPIRRAAFFRWCLGAGLRVVKPMTLMAMGEYHEPRAAFFPSVGY